jgi:hypothetical protein
VGAVKKIKIEIKKYPTPCTIYIEQREMMVTDCHLAHSRANPGGNDRAAMISDDNLWPLLSFPGRKHQLRV